MMNPRETLKQATGRGFDIVWLRQTLRAVLKENERLMFRWHKADDQRAEWMSRAVRSEAQVASLREALRLAFKIMREHQDRSRRSGGWAVSKRFDEAVVVVERALAASQEGEGKDGS